MVWLPKGVATEWLNNFDDMFSRLDKTSACDKQTDRWTSCSLRKRTSSSAVAERPRDALCLSAVSLNKMLTRAESFIIVT